MLYAEPEIIRKINAAEGIFLPCFDKTLLRLECFTPQSCKLSANFDSLGIESAAESFSVTWRGHVNLQDYDRVLFFLNLPPYMQMKATAVADGKEYALLQDIGGDAPVELSGKLYAGAKLTELHLGFSCEPGERDQHFVILYWVGAVNSEREHEIEEALPRYSVEDWEPYLNEGVIPRFENSILFSESDMRRIQTALSDPALSDFLNEVQSLAETVYRDAEPEREIREFLPVGPHLYRYARVRDRGRKGFDGILSLAVAGYLLQRPEWSYMAARMILCAVKTPCWFEGPQCCMEGSTWHHVCFCEEAMVSAIGIAMGFLGGIFTEKALAEIKATMEKHFQMVLKCCREKGYRKYSNQGMVEASGRMLGDSYFYMTGDVSYQKDLEDCYREHTAMICDYINEENHCVEGIGYYMYSIGQSILLWKAYARAKGLELGQVIPQRVKDSVSYVEAFMSTTSPAGTVVPTSNSHGGLLKDLLLSVFASVCQWPDGKEYSRYRIQNQLFDDDKNLVSVLLLLCYRSDTTEKPEPQAAERYYIFEKSGLGVYRHENGKFWFCAERNPRTGHFHADRGSVLLEAYGDMVLADPGVTHYGNILSAYMGKESYHNLAHPEGIPMKVQSDIAAISADEAGIGCRTVVTLADFEHPTARINYIRNIERGLEFSAELEELYDERVLTARREGSYKVAEDNAQLALCDTWEFTEHQSLFVNFMSYGPWQIEGAKASVRLQNSMLTLRFTSDSAFALSCDDSMQDYDLRQMYRLRLKTEAGNQHKIYIEGVIEKL